MSNNRCDIIFIGTGKVCGTIANKLAATGIVSDTDAAFQMLRRHDVRRSSTVPQTLPDYPKDAAGIKAFYFKDFDHHILELIEFPPDKIQRKWCEAAKDESKLFLGIDHTAIVVENTEKGLEFYRDIMQMKISGESENYGTEQEHLNNVCGARVRVASLETAKSGIGVELLSYRSPTGGKPFPPDTQANDVWHWQTSFVSANLNNTAILKSRNIDFISNDVVSLETETLVFEKAVPVRDPDGHAAGIVE